MPLGLSSLIAPYDRYRSKIIAVFISVSRPISEPRIHCTSTSGHVLNQEPCHRYADRSIAIEILLGRNLLHACESQITPEVRMTTHKLTRVEPTNRSPAFRCILTAQDMSSISSHHDNPPFRALRGGYLCDCTLHSIAYEIIRLADCAGYRIPRHLDTCRITAMHILSI